MKTVSNRILSSAVVEIRNYLNPFIQSWDYSISGIKWSAVLRIGNYQYSLEVAEIGSMVEVLLLCEERGIRIMFPAWSEDAGRVLGSMINVLNFLN